MAGCRIGELLHARAVEILEPLASEHGTDVPFRDAFALASLRRRCRNSGRSSSKRRSLRIIT